MRAAPTASVFDLELERRRRQWPPELQHVPSRPEPGSLWGDGIRGMWIAEADGALALFEYGGGGYKYAVCPSCRDWESRGLAWRDGRLLCGRCRAGDPGRAA